MVLSITVRLSEPVADILMLCKKTNLFSFLMPLPPKVVVLNLSTLFKKCHLIGFILAVPHLQELAKIQLLLTGSQD